jgi:tetratricopeptide (TPR) repeat protein
VYRHKYWAFLSYSHSDALWAGWLHRALESYRPPRRLVGRDTERGPVPRRLAPVFRDREELATATDLGTVLNAALEQSAAQIVICSPRAARSRWVNEEILAFKRLGRSNRIFCLIVDGEPNASDVPDQKERECFPPALRFQLAPDGTLSSTRTEPIAADARPGKDGRTNAKLKLIAGVLGVGFDELKQREQQRRHRQMLVITSSALAGMVLTSGLATIALIARATAQRETLRAEAEAETARQTTSFLVDLFRISDPGEARGNSVTAREMLDKGAARIQKELSTQPAVQATMMDTVGTVYTGLGLYAQAQRMLDGALNQRRRLRAEPEALADSLTHLGDLLTRRAEYERAERIFRETAVLARAQPENRRLQVAAANSLYGLGTVLAQEGRYQEAERTLREALARQRRIYPAAHQDTARTLQVLSKVVNQGGNLAAAVPLMRAALSMQRELHGAGPHPDLAEVINDLGLLLEESGAYDAAEQHFQDAIAMKRVLLGDRHPEIAMGLSNLAYVLQDKGKLAEAEETYRQALSMQRELLGAAHPDVANTLNNLAFVQYDRGKVAEALETEREALRTYRKLFPADHPEVARVMNRIGYWLTEAGEYGEAASDLQEALAMRKRLLGDAHPDVASSLTHLAILQLATGYFDEALLSARDAVRIYEATLPSAHWRTAVAASVEGAALARLGNYDEAERLLGQATDLLSKDTGVLPTYRALAAGYLNMLHEQRTRFARKHDSGATMAARKPAASGMTASSAISQ